MDSPEPGDCERLAVRGREAFPRIVQLEVVGVDLPAAEIADQEVVAELAETAGCIKANPQGDWRFPVDVVSEAICLTNVPSLVNTATAPPSKLGPRYVTNRSFPRSRTP